ncbi:hypothetical protein [Streptomyces goshikiensis]
MNACVCGAEVNGIRLCGRCRAATAGRLQRMQALYRILAYALELPAAPPAYGRTRLVTAPMPVSGPVLDLRGPGGIVGILEDWRAGMHTERDWAPPAVRGDIETRVGHAASGLLNSLYWISNEWAEAGTFATEVRRLDEAALAAICPPDTPLERGERLGPCPAETGPGAVCGAVLRYYRTEAKTVTCPWCGVVYPPSSWADLKTWMDHDQHGQEEELLAAG